MTESHFESKTNSPTVPIGSALIAGCGYVGHRVAAAWTKAGIATHAITRSAEKAEKLAAEGISPLILNLGSSNDWPAIPDVDLILWCVGYDRAVGSDRNAAWIDGLRRLLQALPERNTPRRILYTSSTGVYGDGQGMDVNEQTPVNPNSEGGKACVAAESLLQTVAATSADRVYILRLAGIYGPDRLLRRISDLRSGTPLATAPDDWLNLIHVDDAVRVIDRVATSEHPLSFGESDSTSDAAIILNVVAANSVTRREYYSTLAKLVAAPTPVFADTASIGSTEQTNTSQFSRRSSGNRRIVSRCRKELGVPFQYDDCETGLADAIARSELAVP